MKGSKGSTNADEQLTELRQDGLPSLGTLKPIVRCRKSLWLWVKAHIEDEIDDVDMQKYCPDFVDNAKSLLESMNEEDENIDT